jgi:hypothetical protein
MMSILPPSSSFLVLTHFATFLLWVRITSYINTQLERVNSAGAAWWSRLLRMEWSGLFGGRKNDCGRKDCKQLGQPSSTTAIFMVATTRSSTLHNDAGQHWVELFSSSFGLRLCGDGNSIACVSTTMSQCIHLHWNSYFLLHFWPKTIFLFLIWCYLLHPISYFGCSKNYVQFSLMLHFTIILVCFMLVVPSLYILPLFWLSC